MQIISDFILRAKREVLGFQLRTIIIITLFVFFILRLIFSVWPTFDTSLSGTDLATFRQWSLLLINEGFSNFYQKAQFFPYPPVANYFFYSLGTISKSFGLPINGAVMTLLVKLPNIIGDILTGLLLFLIAKDYLSFKKAYLLMLTYLILPASFFITTFWGQWDGLMTFFLVLSFYLLIRRNLILGYISMLIAALIKPQAIPFIFPLLAMGLRTSDIKKTLWGILVSAAAFFFLFYPFYREDPFLGPWSYWQNSLKTFPPKFTSSGFNFWYLLYGGWRDDFPMLFGLSTIFWARILTAFFILLSMILVYFRKRFALAIGLSGYAFFLFFTQVHERYFYPVLPFVLLTLFWHSSKTSIMMAIVISLIFAINSIGFYWGWIKLGLWNSTFLSTFYIDKIIAVLYLLGFVYLIASAKIKELWLKKSGFFFF